MNSEMSLNRDDLDTRTRIKHGYDVRQVIYSIGAIECNSFEVEEW